MREAPQAQMKIGWSLRLAEYSEHRTSQVRIEHLPGGDRYPSIALPILGFDYHGVPGAQVKAGRVEVMEPAGRYQPDSDYVRNVDTFVSQAVPRVEFLDAW